MSQKTHLAAVFDCKTIIVGYYNWGEPERAPHRRVERSQSIYYYYYYYYYHYYGTYVTRAPL